MELIEGGTLRELLRERGPMPPHAAAAVLGPVLGGLAVAHRAGLVHRDVKPENVLISDDGEVKIADFGLVRAVAEAKITSTSVILGTAAYLSPEQVGTGDAGPRSDVYAVGILTYELLTGRTPFTGDNALAVAYQRMDNDVAPPSTVIGGCASTIRRAGVEGDRARSRRAVRGCRCHGRANSTRSSTSWGCPNSGCRRHAIPPSTLGGAVPQQVASTPPPTRSPRAGTPGSSPAGPTTGRRPGDHEYRGVSKQFAGIEMSEFHWARQRAKRVLLFWVVGGAGVHRTRRSRRMDHRQQYRWSDLVATQAFPLIDPREE